MEPKPTNTMPITDGMTVRGADGERLGTVRDYDPEAGYIDIQKGWLFPKDFFVGLAAIAAVEKDGITLRLIKATLQDERFAAPPARGSFANSGMVAPAATSFMGEKDPPGEEGDIKTPPPSGIVY